MRDRWQLLTILTVLFVASRLGFYLAGVGLDGSARGQAGSWQVLDPALLRPGAIAQSLLYLHAQPPLFNVEIAILLAIPTSIAHSLLMFANPAMGLAMALATYLVCIELNLPRWVAFATSVFFMTDPGMVLYEDWLFYTYPTAVLVVLSALACIRFVRYRTTWSGIGFFSTTVAIYLLNSSFQLFWLLPPLALVVFTLRKEWRRVLKIAAIPLLLVVFWFAKDAILFGTYTTSSWFGMNLARTVIVQLGPGEVQSDLKKGIMTPLSQILPFNPISAYAPRFLPLPKTGIQALDETFKQNGYGPNMNNKAFIQVSADYLHDDLRVIASDPRHYLHDINSALRVWFVPTDDYFEIQSSRPPVLGYAQAYDHFVLAEPSAYGDLGNLPAGNQMSRTTIAIYLVALLFPPVLILRRRRRDPAYAVGLTYLWFTVLYVFLLTSLVEYGENMRFRVELGTLPTIAVVVVATSIVRTLLVGWHKLDNPPPEDVTELEASAEYAGLSH